MTLTANELKTIVHSLKISGLSFLEQDAIDPIRGMIKNLPSSETIDNICSNSDMKEKLCASIGVIMSKIDDFGSQDSASTVRYRVKTRISPRYKNI